MLDTLIIAVVIAVFALAVFAALGWMSMCGYLGGQAARMLVRRGQNDGYVPHIPSAQELADEANSKKIAQLLRESDAVMRETRRVLRETAH